MADPEGQGVLTPSFQNRNCIKTKVTLTFIQVMLKSQFIIRKEDLNHLTPIIMILVGGKRFFVSVSIAHLKGGKQV